MGNMERHLGHASSSTTSLHYQLTDLWRSPRGTVLRIEALALVAITLSFLLSVFGSCRRWSNRWIVQKGFLAAQVLSLSLGTYSIGLMQSSSVKSEMYPIWAVSLLTLFGCVDPITSYNGLDYNGPLSKAVFQLCLYCGYVVLMSVSTISSVVGNKAIDVLCAITFIKGFHRSMALVLTSERRDQIEAFSYTEVGALVVGGGKGLQVIHPNGSPRCLQDWWLVLGFTANEKTDIENVCMGYYLYNLLKRHILGLDNASSEMEKKREEFKSLVQDGRVMDFKRSLKAIEVALGFLYEAFFTSNEFLHYYEARTSSFWALASLVGICFVGLDLAIPWGMVNHSQHRIASAGTGGGAGSTVVVGTTTADLIITFVILVSLALVQLVQLIRCWVSNWARVTFASEYAASTPSTYTSIRGSSRDHRGDIVTSFDRESVQLLERPTSWGPWMRLRAFMITRINWFDKYLWQDRIGQYSLVADKTRKGGCISTCSEIIECCGEIVPNWINRIWVRMNRMLGMQYIRRVLWELLVASSSTKGGAGVRLHDDVKASIADFLGQIKSTRIGVDWVSLFLDNGLGDCSSELPYALMGQTPDAYAFTHRVMVWHTATCYCEEAELQASAAAGGGGDGEKNRRVAIDLSKYCAYLVMSAPELLPGPSTQTKRALDGVVMWTSTRGVVRGDLEDAIRGDPVNYGVAVQLHNAFDKGLYWGQRLRRCSDSPWKVLALLWVQTLLYAAPYGKMEAHLQRIAQGGEFITHIWALLFHIGIERWECDLPAIAQAETKKEEEAVEQEPGEPSQRASSTTNIEESVD